ncbi:MAG: L-seryl-tRNA(Sec) selenium transferase, partial [Oscillospiraceae bacterium]|nr:L-seryl-tRNA(Sec) selenium transferase [Oscillospiraceae bacterium]
MKELLRKIPKVDELLRSACLAEAIDSYGDHAVTEAIRAELDALRQGILQQQITAMPEPEALCSRICKRAQRVSRPSFQPVINGTGILLHTNLGRACLSEKAARAVYEATKAYSNLEYDLTTGKRGSRYSHVEDILCRLTGAESALVVNNN